MAEKHTSIRGGLYKCLGCGQIITLPDERDTMLAINGTSANVNLVGEKSAKRFTFLPVAFPMGFIFSTAATLPAFVCATSSAWR